MLWLLFTAIYIIGVFSSPTQVSNLTPADLELIESVAKTSLIIITPHGQKRFTRTCSAACKFLRLNGTTGGDCFTLFLTTPTCLYFPSIFLSDDRQCMNIPGRENRTMTAIALTALDRCRNGTVDRFEGGNITKGDGGKVIHQTFNSSANATVQRRSSVLQSCSTSLFVGEPSNGTKNGVDLILVVALAVTVLIGMASGIELG